METIVPKVVILLLKHTHSKTSHKNHISTHRGQLNKSRVPSTSSKWQGLGLLLLSCSSGLFGSLMAPPGFMQLTCFSSAFYGYILSIALFCRLIGNRVLPWAPKLCVSESRIWLLVCIPPQEWSEAVWRGIWDPQGSLWVQSLGSESPSYPRPADDFYYCVFVVLQTEQTGWLMVFCFNINYQKGRLI